MQGYLFTLFGLMVLQGLIILIAEILMAVEETENRK